MRLEKRQDFLVQDGALELHWGTAHMEGTERLMYI